MNKAELKHIRSRIDETLKALGEELCMQFHAGNCSYQEDRGTFKLEFIKRNENGTVTSQARKDFAKYSYMHGLKPEDIDRIFENRGEKYRVTGLLPRRRKYPIEAKRIKDGKCFIFGIDTVKRELGYPAIETFHIKNG